MDLSRIPEYIRNVQRNGLLLSDIRRELDYYEATGLRHDQRLSHFSDDQLAEMELHWNESKERGRCF